VLCLSQHARHRHRHVRGLAALTWLGSRDISIRSSIEAILAFVKSLEPEKTSHAVDVRARELAGSLRAFADDPHVRPKHIVLGREHPYLFGLALAALVLRIALGYHYRSRSSCGVAALNGRAPVVVSLLFILI
jgi:hypothetical protein